MLMQADMTSYSNSNWDTDIFLEVLNAACFHNLVMFCICGSSTNRLQLKLKFSGLRSYLPIFSIAKRSSPSSLASCEWYLLLDKNALRDVEVWLSV